jgi:hypothetical protein
LKGKRAKQVINKILFGGVVPNFAAEPSAQEALVIGYGHF